MRTIDQVPPHILTLLGDKGFDTADLRLAVRSDVDMDGRYADVWLVLCGDDFAVLSGYDRVQTARKPLATLPEIKPCFEQLDYRHFDFAQMEEPKVEQLISGNHLSVNVGGERQILCRFSHTRLTDMNLFIALFSKLKEGGCITDADFDREDSLFCPKCGMRYPDQARKLCPKCMDKGTLWKRILFFFGKYKRYVALSMGFMVLNVVLSIVSPLVGSQLLYDEVLVDAGTPWYGQALLYILILLGFRLLLLGIQVLQGRTVAKMSARVVYDVKDTVFTAMQKLSLSFFNSRQTGGLMNRVNSDAQSLFDFFVDGVPNIAVSATTMIGVCVIMFTMQWKLTLVVLTCVPLFFFAIRFTFALFDRLWRRRWSSFHSMNSQLGDSLSGIRVVKAFAKEGVEGARFEAANARATASDCSVRQRSATIWPLLGLIINASTYVVWLVGGWMVVKGTLTFGEYMTFSAYMSMIYGPVGFFAQISSWWTNCTNSIQRIFEVLDARPDVCEAENPVPMPEMQGAVEFKDVSFHYVVNKDVIKKASFAIGAGQTIGIVGRTGAGKSTIANLITRLYDVSDGEVLIDGVNIKDIAIEDLRKNISIVSQEIFIFMGTIADNIRYARPDATMEEVIAAATIANAHEFIAKLPEGYETYVGDSRRRLSGGERQRISIARAILRNPKILILDEATASMDTTTERRIQEALTRLVKGRTTVIIAHRLSTLRDADVLAVIDEGKVAEYGTHAELFARKGIYHKLYTLQLEALKNVGVE